MVLRLIDSYDFGSIVINRKRYTSDVIVFPEQVIEGWWRRIGHGLCVEDLKEILNRKPKPRVLVVGTGYYGRVKIPSEVKEKLQIHGIELVAQPTLEACHTFNEFLKSGKKVAGAFHLTC